MSKIKCFLKNNYCLVIAILVSLALVLLWFASLTEQEMLILFSSDALNLSSIYHDIFIDGNSVQGWTFNAAPNFIPDMLLFFTLMAITSNFLTATFLFSFIQYFAIVFLFYAIFRQIAPLKSSVFSFFVYLFSFFLLFFLISKNIDNNFYYSFLIMSNSYHNGMFLMTLLCVLLSIRFFKKESWKTLILLFLLTAIAYPCDKLFLIAYICPMLLVSIVLLIGRENKRKICKFGIVHVLGLLSGMAILYNLEHNTVFELTKMHQFINIDGISNSWNMFYSQIKFYLSEISFNCLTVLLSIISFIWTAYYCINQFIRIRQKKQELSLFFIFESFVLFFVPMVIIAPILNGNYLGYDCIRYNYFVFIVLLFNLVLLSSHFLEKHKYFTIGLNGFLGLTLSVFIVWNICKMDFVSGLQNYFSNYTERARNIDIQFSENKAPIYGITDDYWYAKHVTMFSRNNIRLYVTYPNAIPFSYFVNRNWYFGGGNWKHANPQFTFLLWTSDLPLPDFFITENPPYKSCVLDNGNTLHLVQPFIFDTQTVLPKLLEE